MSYDFTADLTNTTASVEARLKEVMTNQVSSEINAPMVHSVLNGGKRLRAFLVVKSADLFEVPSSAALSAAASIECMHAYSLVHDDLPCMDDDDLRRGQPTVHVKWDDATAVLAGDALHALSFELLADLEEVPSERKIQLIKGLANSSGALGMVNGQAQDIAAETAKTPLNLEEIIELQSNKTGALIEWSAIAGAIMSGQDTTALRKYANSIGLAFQIQDDILDVTGDASLAGKKLQKDADAGKATFVSIMGLEEAQAEAKTLVETAIEAIDNYGEAAEPLRQVAQFIIERNM